MTWRHAPVAALLLMLASSGLAAAADSADLIFWTTVENSRNADELNAYLHAFPHGQFASLAQVRLKELQGAAGPAQRPAGNARGASATIEMTRPVVRAIDRIEFDVDGSGLQSGSNWRVAVFRAGAPDKIANPNAFALDGVAVTAELLHLTLPPAPVGNDEVRLLYIPQFASTYAVAARAPLKVLPGAPGAALAYDLTTEAGMLGPVRFEAKYRDRQIKLEGQFLRVQASDSGIDWNAIARGKYTEPRSIAAISIGVLGNESDMQGPTEVVCLLPGDNRQMLDRVAAMTAGDDVVVAGTPTTWTSAFGGSEVVLDRCSLAR
jgi:hypothetical protein